MRSPFVALRLFLCTCSGGGGGGSSTPPPPPPPPPPSVSANAVWGLSPFPVNCGGTGGIAYINSEVEPHVAVNPRDANHLVGVWQQDRWSNGSARGLLTGVSFDGGTTWSAFQAPFSECTGGNAANGGNYDRATDPWVTFAPDGTLYQSAVTSTGGTFAIGSRNAVLVSRSGDGGRTWSNPATLIADTAPFFNDKETITADPTDARFVYAVWDRVQERVAATAASSQAAREPKSAAPLESAALGQDFERRVFANLASARARRAMR